MMFYGDDAWTFMTIVLYTVIALAIYGAYALVSFLCGLLWTVVL